MAGRALSHREAKAFYDRFGSKQDLQCFYEDPAIHVLLRHGEFEKATAVVELGCGTGRLAARLLEQHLPPASKYLGIDISPTMIELSRGRVARWANRAEIERTDGSLSLPVQANTQDRFLSTYVLDLLSEDDICTALGEARRVLVPSGRICLASLTFGQTWASRQVCRVWSAIHSMNPRLVGGCRPLELMAFMEPEWSVLHREIVCAFGICTEVVIAAPA